MRIHKLLLLATLLLAFAVNATAQKKESFAIGDKTFLLNGKPFIVKAAEVHYPRIPRPYWEHRIKMCKALGMNTLCLYVFWNIHEQQEGVFDFTDNNDVAEFCRLAQKNGMYVIVRPGPYVCAEWEMGGLPWWLLKKKDIRLREQDPYFMERVKIFEQKVGEQLSPLTIQNGGPIIMIQVENEYGSYGEDKPYVSEIRDCLRSIYGNDMTLFQCDWSSNFTKNGLDDLVWTMNFGTGANIDDQFRRLGELRPNAPKMCSEFWSGWFDKWGARHETRPAKDMVEGMEEMLSKGISFSLYMTHGGTSFGHWAGANSPGFAPDVTSYDYDAPINEWGLATPKFWELREMMAKYNDGKKMPAVPKAPMPIVTVPKFELTEHASLAQAISGLSAFGEGANIKSSTIHTFEEMNMGWGSMIYMASLPEISTQSYLQIDAHDFAQVFINGKYIGKVDRVKNEKGLLLPPVKKDDMLQILVEGMGRINFGRAIKDYKGIVAEPVITATIDDVETSWTPKKWIQIPIPDNYETAIYALNNAKSKPNTSGDNDLATKRGYYRGFFNLGKVGDTFLNLETWGKGQVYVNGHPIGRFWSIGPQQTLYVPGCWLKKGKNEVVILDVAGPKQTVAWGQDKPELDKLQIEKTNLHNDIANKPDLNSATPAVSSSFADGNGWQNVKFGKKQTGRYLAIEILSAHNGKELTAIAEIYALGADGKRLSREPWTVKYADSEDDANGNRTGDKVYDLQESTYWQTCRGANFPHLLVIDLGSVQTITGIEYLPRAEQGAPGSIKDYKIYIY